MTKESRWLALFVVVAVAPALPAATQAPNPARAPQTVMVPAGGRLSTSRQMGATTTKHNSSKLRG